MTKDEQPLAQRARALGCDDPDFLRALEKTESAASAKSMAVIRNGIFPKWSLERWVLLIGFGVTFGSSTFDWGGKYKAIEMKQEQITSALGVVERKVDGVSVDVGEMKVEQARVRTQLDIEADRDAGRKRTPVFSRPGTTVQ